MPEPTDRRIGLAFPLQLGEKDKSGRRHLVGCTYEEHIKQSLRALLLTARGERVMRPEFGSGLGIFIFEGIDATTASLIKSEVESAVARFEPRVELLDVQVAHNPRDPGVLRIELSYRIKSSGAVDQLSMSVAR
jgi:phage baseplate assembly protein W